MRCTLLSGKYLSANKVCATRIYTIPQMHIWLLWNRITLNVLKNQNNESESGKLSSPQHEVYTGHPQSLGAKPPHLAAVGYTVGLTRWSQTGTKPGPDTHVSIILGRMLSFSPCHFLSVKWIVSCVLVRTEWVHRYLVHRGGLHSLSTQEMLAGVIIYVLHKTELRHKWIIWVHFSPSTFEFIIISDFHISLSSVEQEI